MRIAVIADIHGNMPALEAVLADIQRRDVDRTINLGDCVSQIGPTVYEQGGSNPGSVSLGNRVARASTVAWAAQRQ